MKTRIWIFGLLLFVYSCDATYTVDKSKIRSNRIFDYQGFIMEKISVDSISSGLQRDTLIVDSIGNIIQKFYHEKGVPVLFRIDTTVILNNRSGEGRSRIIYFRKPNPGYYWTFHSPAGTEELELCPIPPKDNCWYRFRGLRGSLDTYSRVLFVHFTKEGGANQYSVEKSGPF